MAPLTLTKHHGLGNDFLVLLDPPTGADLASLAVALCDRRRGVGADGLIAAVRGDDSTVARMVLHNADGGRAEMSGNGIRCLAQALLDAGWARDCSFTIETDAGPKRVTVDDERAAGLRDVSVDMGQAKVTALGDRQAEVDTGNPHLVLLVGDPAGADLLALGARHPDVNVEVVRVDDRTTLTMRVHERGAGITQACGTGSCAVAAATRAWGLTGDEVVVHNPGGPLAVRLDGDVATLTGPAQLIATIEVPAWS